MLTKNEENLITQRKGVYVSCGFIIVGFLVVSLEIVLHLYTHNQSREIGIKALSLLGLFGSIVMTIYIISLYKIIIKLKA